MRTYRLLEITAHYEGYIKKVYRSLPELKDYSYSELHNYFNNDGYSDLYIHKHLHALGIESDILYWNNRTLQSKYHGGRGKELFEILLTQIQDYKPDIILSSVMNDFDAEQLGLIRSCLKKSGHLVGYHFCGFSKNFYNTVKYYDQIYTGNKQYVDYINEQGGKAFLLQHAFEPSILNGLDKKVPKKETCFSGSIFLDIHMDRVRMLQKLKRERIKVDFYGEIVGEGRDKVLRELKVDNADNKYITFHDACYGMDYYQNISSYTINLNIHAKNPLGGTGNMRLFEVTGVGSCLITDYKEGIYELFEKDTEIVTYRTFDEMIDKIKWLLKDEETAADIAKKGQIRTLSSYTYENKAAELNKYIQLLL